jgi:NAD-dependent deacetylase
MIPDELIERLGNARRVVVLTGAGISAESGVPTFREALTGLWVNYKPEELATPEAFIKNPKLVWDWYQWRRELVGQAEPNPGHHALAVMEKHIPEFLLITQNVDGLHARAGSNAIIELHGNIHRTKCFREGTVVEEWRDAEESPPRCPNCGSWLRPDVVWFGEMLPGAALQAAIKAANESQVFLSIGTSGIVQPAASLPHLAIRHGAICVEVNPEETPLTHSADYFLQGPAGVILPHLVKRTWRR